MVKIDKTNFVKTCQESGSMSIACSSLGLHYNTFRRYAIKFECYKPNPGGKGLSKDRDPKIPLQDILDGKRPEYQTFKLKKRLIKAGIKKNICEVCGLTEWNKKPIEMELDHINGVSNDHKLNNLRIICPNCHSQTETFRAKNIK